MALFPVILNVGYYGMKICIMIWLLLSRKTKLYVFCDMFTSY